MKAIVLTLLVFCSSALALKEGECEGKCFEVVA